MHFVHIAGDNRCTYSMMPGLRRPAPLHAAVMLTWRKVSPSAHLMVDPRNGARAVIRDTGADAGRFLWRRGGPEPSAVRSTPVRGGARIRIKDLPHNDPGEGLTSFDQRGIPRRPLQRHCGTGIWSDRDIAAGCRDIEPTLRVSAEPVAKPAAHSRAESRGSRPTNADSGERLTLRWRRQSRANPSLKPKFPC
jgi:hypothetical protein